MYSCTLPADWDGEWHDSSDTTQDITITRSSSYVVGWGLTVYSSAFTSWTCVDEDTSNNFLLFKQVTSAHIFKKQIKLVYQFYLRMEKIDFLITNGKN